MDTEEEEEEEDEIFVKPEYLTPHLPPQPLPIQQHISPPHSDLSSPRSSITPDRHLVRVSHTDRDPFQPPPSNLFKKRRVTITDEHLIGHNHASQSPHSLAPLTIQPPCSPKQQSRSHNHSHSHSGSNNDPVSPLVIGFTQPHNPNAMQQMANTIKLREEQKRLIEQRRNSFAGPLSGTFSSSGQPSHPPSGNGMLPPPPSGPLGHGRSPPGSQSRISHRGSLSKPMPNNNTSSTTNSSSVNHHHHHSGHPPVINLKPISEASKSSNSHQRTYATNGPQTARPAPPRYSPPAFETEQSQSTIASRRSQATREKVKNLAIMPQAYRAQQILVQPSIKSAPMRSGFLSSTAANGDIIKTPLIARTNLNPSGGGGNGQQVASQHPLRSSHGPPTHSHGPGGGGSQQGISGAGLERRMTMHAGVPLQVPTLTHVPMFNGSKTGTSSTANAGRPNGSAHHHSVSLMAGPRTAMPSFGGSGGASNSMQQQLEASARTPRGGPLGGPVPASPALAQGQAYPSTSSHSHSNNLSPPRHSIGSSTSTSHPNHNHNPIPPKQMFLQLFDTFYDSLADSRILQTNLEEQIRRSAQLLGLLQQSSSVFEKMLDERVGAIQAEYTRDLQILEARLDRLEENGIGGVGGHSKEMMIGGSGGGTGGKESDEVVGRHSLMGINHRNLAGSSTGQQHDESSGTVGLGHQQQQQQQHQLSCAHSDQSEHLESRNVDD